MDWLWTLARQRFGGKMHARQNGIKPFLVHIKQGQMGYYLPDEDFGAEQSVFVDFLPLISHASWVKQNGEISKSGGYSNVPTL